MNRFMLFFIWIYDFIRSLPYLVLSKQTNIKKVYIIICYFYSLFSNVILGFRKIYFSGYKFWSFNGKTTFALFNEIFFKNEYLFFCKKQNPYIIDWWANTWFSAIFFKTIYPKCTIDCFEPNKKAFDILKRNISDNNIIWVNCYNLAISDKEWYLDFFDSEEPSFTTWIHEWRSWHYNKTKVKSVRLLDHIKNKHVDLLKIDIEWWEDVIFFDFEENWAFENIKEIILEYHHNIKNKITNLPEILGILKKNWYDYIINTTNYHTDQHNNFQDILITAKKSDIIWNKN